MPDFGMDKAMVIDGQNGRIITQELHAAGPPGMLQEPPSFTMSKPSFFDVDCAGDSSGQALLQDLSSFTMLKPSLADVDGAGAAGG